MILFQFWIIEGRSILVYGGKWLRGPL